MEEGRSGTPESPPLGALILIPMNPEVQGMFDASYRLGHGFF